MSAEKGKGFFGMRRRWLLLIAASAWLLLFGAVAWPTLNMSRAYDEEIEDLSDRVDRLNEWSAMSPCSRDDVVLWEKNLAQSFDTSFPRERGLQDLFYDLSRIANEIGIDPISVKEIQDRRRPAESTTIDPETSELMHRLGMRPNQLPGNRISAHEVNVGFESSYEKLARFLDALPEIRRAVAVKTLDLKHGAQGVSVNLELEYYVQAL